jgi:hypothetical protein
MERDKAAKQLIVRLDPPVFKAFKMLCLEESTTATKLIRAHILDLLDKKQKQEAAEVSHELT